jgi:hypothetical protein
MFWAGAVTPDYFGLMGIPILQGRALQTSDSEKAEPIIVVSAATARRYWPHQNPIGKHVQLVWEDRWWTVVGVAGDVRQFDLADRSPNYIRGAMYMPYAQAEDTDAGQRIRPGVNGNRTGSQTKRYLCGLLVQLFYDRSSFHHNFALYSSSLISFPVTRGIACRHVNDLHGSHTRSVYAAKMSRLPCPRFFCGNFT